MYCSHPIQGGMSLSLFHKPLSIDIGKSKRDVNADAFLGSLNSDPVKNPKLFPMKVSPRMVNAL